MNDFLSQLSARSFGRSSDTATVRPRRPALFEPTEPYRNEPASAEFAEITQQAEAAPAIAPSPWHGEMPAEPRRETGNTVITQRAVAAQSETVPPNPAPRQQSKTAHFLGHEEKPVLVAPRPDSGPPLPQTEPPPTENRQRLLDEPRPAKTAVPPATTVFAPLPAIMPATPPAQAAPSEPRPNARTSETAVVKTETRRQERLPAKKTSRLSATASPRSEPAKTDAQAISAIRPLAQPATNSGANGVALFQQAPEPRAASSAAESAPTIHVSIGRIEILAHNQPAPSRPKAAAAAAMSLDDYLRRRNGGGR